MHSTVLYTAILTRLATATFYNGGKNGTGYYYEGAYGDNVANGIPDISPFQSAAVSPNASNSINVHGFTWRTNVSEVFVNDATTIPPNGTAIANARVITSVFDLSWQGNGTIGDVLQSQGVVAPYGCIMMLDGLGLSENVTNRYAAADNGSCTNVLGGDCVRDFLAGIPAANGSQCPELPTAQNLPASCAGTLGTVQQTGFNGLVENLEDIQGGLSSGQGFAHILSSAFNGTDAMTALQQAESRLQILVIPGLNAMACQKVNSSATAVSTPTPAGATPSTTTTNAASGALTLSYSALGMGVFGALFMGL